MVPFLEIGVIRREVWLFSLNTPRFLHLSFSMRKNTSLFFEPYSGALPKETFQECIVHKQKSWDCKQ